MSYELQLCNYFPAQAGWPRTRNGKIDSHDMRRQTLLRPTPISKTKECSDRALAGGAVKVISERKIIEQQNHKTKECTYRALTCGAVKVTSVKAEDMGRLKR